MHFCGGETDGFCSGSQDYHYSPYLRRSWIHHAGGRAGALPDVKGRTENKIATFYWGRAAEELIFHSITTGASNDIEQATKIARGMISRYGMSDEFDMVAMESMNNQYLGGDSSLSCSFETQTLLDKR